jgi:hypothetical protein
MRRIKMLRRVLWIAGALALAAGAGWAAQTTYTVINGSNALQTMCTYTYGSTNFINCMVPVEPTGGLPTTGGTPTHTLSAASNNSTNVKNAAGVLLNVTIVNTTTTAGDFRVYNTASAPTCSSATGVVWNVPIPANTTAAGIVIPIPGGMYLGTGISFCYTGANADNDNTNAVTGVNINLLYN